MPANIIEDFFKENFDLDQTRSYFYSVLV